MGAEEFLDYVIKQRQKVYKQVIQQRAEFWMIEFHLNC